MLVPVVGLVLLTASLYFAGLGGVLRYAYPGASFVVAVWLYFRSRPTYITYTCWIWFLTAFVRRLADYKAGYQEPSIVLIAPYMVSAVGGLDLMIRIRELARPRNFPIVCALVAIVYGILVGLTKYSLRQMTPSILNWVAPVFFAFCLMESYREYEEVRSRLQRTFAAATLLMGLYGIYQFFFLPQWDALWLTNVNTLTFGSPEPFQLRAFSTMNAPVIYGLTAMGILLVSLVAKSRLKLLVVASGFIALMFSFIRSAWIGFVAGAIYLLIKMNMKERIRILGMLGASLLVSWSVLLVPGAKQPVVDKLQTMANPSDDSSFNARIEGYMSAFRTLVDEPFGEGVASPDIDHQVHEDDDAIGPHDSMILELLYSLGWFGTFAYLTALGVVISRAVTHKSTDRPFENSMKAIVVALFAQCPLNDIVYGEVGWVLWTACAIQMAAIAYAEDRQEEFAAAPALPMHVQSPALAAAEESGS